MKTLKRKIALLLALCMVLTGVTPAYADVETVSEAAAFDPVILEEDENVGIVEEASCAEADYDLATPSDAEYTETEEPEERLPKEIIPEKATPSNAKREGEILIRETIVDGIRITLTADPGVFPEDAELWAERVEDEAAKEAIEEAVEKERDSSVNVAKSYKFDIKMLLDGEEIQPDTSKGSVKVTFTLEEKLNECLTANAYHLKEEADGELTAENLEAEVKTVEASVPESAEEAALFEDDETLSDGIIELEAEVNVNVEVTEIKAEVTGFSYYVVEFTYDELQYVLPGDSSIKLSEILKTLAIEGTVSEAEVSNNKLFAVTKDTEGDDWTVTAFQAFSSKEWMKVKIDRKVYEITVTDAQASFEYYDYVDGEIVKKSIPNDTVTEYTIIDSSIVEPDGGYTFESGKWYVVKGSVTFIQRIQNNASKDTPAHLILVDGNKLKASIGIHNPDGKGLVIYGQSAGSGELYIPSAPGNSAGIGGEDNESGGNITVNGGTVTSSGGHDGSGIGGGRFGSGGNIKINGGTVTSSGGNRGAGIGGGIFGSGGSITINGGTVTSSGGNEGSGIGGGNDGTGGSITINGGTVTATGGDKGAGIGGGSNGSGGYIIINGGTVTSSGGLYAAGVGGGDYGYGRDVTVSGGKINATGGTDAVSIGGGRFSDIHGTLTLARIPAKITASGTSKTVEELKSGYGTWLQVTMEYVQASYTVEHWKQKTVRGDDYQKDAEATETHTGFVNNYVEVVSKEYPGYGDPAYPPEKIKADGTTKIVAKYDLIYSTISFDANGHGTAPDPIYAVPGAAITAPEDPSAEGYTFGGWYTEPECTNQYVFSTMPEEELLLYAKWTVNQYTIIWKDGNDILKTEKLDYDTMPDYGDDPVKQGYEFMGWRPAVQKVTGDATYSAIFYRIDEGWHRVNFDSRGGTAILAIDVYEGETITAPTAPVREKYTFDGWYKDSSCTAAYDFATPVKTDLILYAKWTENAKPKYTITFTDWDGKLLASVQVEEGGLPVYPKANPTRSGYIFTYWDSVINLATCDQTYKATYVKQSTGGGGGGTVSATIKATPTFSSNWYSDAYGVWRIRNSAGQTVVNAWLCDDVIKANGQNVWYLLTADGSMIANGLVQDNTGNFYSLEIEHNGYFGMLRYQNGTYNCNGQQVYLTFNHEHNGSFGAITNAEGLEKLKQIYGVTQYGIGNENSVYTATF